MNFPVEEGVYHVLTAIGVPNIHFFLAAIPVQLILFFFYLSRRQLPLRESRSFLVLMGWNMVIFLTDLLLVYTDSMGRKEELPFLTLFFFCSVLLETISSSIISAMPCRPMIMEESASGGLPFFRWRQVSFISGKTA